MKKVIVSITALLSLTIPATALAQPKKPTQAAANQAYLTILNEALTKGAPAYVNWSNQDKLSYGHYTCQALDTKIPLDTVLVNYIQAMTKEVPPDLHQQAGFFLGSSMYAGVYSFCPKYLPQLYDWGKKRFAQQ